MHAGTDLQNYGALGSCYAGYHYDLNFLTIHGKSRFPGLAVWLQDGRRLPVSIPSGCLLIQAGKQIEWLTNGHIRAGMHEVHFFHPHFECAYCAIISPTHENRSEMSSEQCLADQGIFRVS